MSSYEVEQPILNGPFDEPKEYWFIKEGEPPQKRVGRRSSIVFPPRDQKEEWSIADGLLSRSKDYENAFEIILVNRTRERVNQWRAQGYPGVSRTTKELLEWWRRDGRGEGKRLFFAQLEAACRTRERVNQWRAQGYPGVSRTTKELLEWWRRDGRGEGKRLFFAQLEAAETVIFLKEARPDFLQGLNIPREEPSDERKAAGFAGFGRYACKMATGSGKTTVMAMLAAWSILNKVNDRNNPMYSDAVLIVCPNVTIRDRLSELGPERGESSIFRTRDIVPAHLMPLLTQGKVVIKNWHVFEPHTMQSGGVSAKVIKTGVPVNVREWIHIGPKTTTARGKRYLSQKDYEKQTSAGILTVRDADQAEDGTLRRVQVESVKYIESDTALVNRVLDREIGGKKNILVMNDEAHHAYRIRRDESNGDDDEDEDESEEFYKEATVWVEGLDRVQKLRGVNFCVDFSATPYFLGRVGQETNKPFPWVVSDFGLIDAIESGLVKIPQLAIRDTTGSEIPGYLNIWRWLMEKLTPAEKGATKASPKPEAVLKWANTPVAMLAGQWDQQREDAAKEGTDPRPPVFIIVCKNTKIAKVLYEWIAEDNAPAGIPSLKIEGFRNRNGQRNTIRVDSKVVNESDSGEAKSDEVRWMRFTLDTVGKLEWPQDSQGRPLYPDGFEDLAKKVERPFHPPGRDVRCIVSVGMLTEGWDCNTVTHIIGLRPFMSQLLCEQVVGRGLRRSSYALGEDGKFSEEVAKVLGVPFEVIPFKANPTGGAAPREKRHHVHAIPEKASLEIHFPRVDGYTQAIRNRVSVNWETVPLLRLEPGRIPPEVELKALSITNTGRPSLHGPGKLSESTLREFRSKRRMQELVFDCAKVLAKNYLGQGKCTIPAHALFPQIAEIVRRYVTEKVIAEPPADKKDLFLAPYWGWLIERLVEAIQPDTAGGEIPEIPIYEKSRKPGSTEDVSFWTSRDVREVLHSHLNYVVADTAKWEQTAAYFIDRHPAVQSFAKTDGMGFAIPYFNNGQPHDYNPDFIIKYKAEDERYLILETKGFDPLAEVKAAAAQRWVSAVNAEGSYGTWHYKIARKPTEVSAAIADGCRQ